MCFQVGNHRSRSPSQRQLLSVLFGFLHRLARKVRRRSGIHLRTRQGGRREMGYRRSESITQRSTKSKTALGIKSVYWHITMTCWFSERKVERSDIGSGEQKNRHGNDLVNDKFRPRIRGGFQSTVHGNWHIDSRHQKNRHHFTDRLFGCVNKNEGSIGFLPGLCTLIDPKLTPLKTIKKSNSQDP